MTDAKFGLWSVPQSPVSIEYSLVVIEEVRHEVSEGFQRLSRGGIEVGGVLYGTRDGRSVRILAMRPIPCEHARGPGFVLSDKDRAGLQEQLVRDQEDPHLEGLTSVGFFLSHTRSEIALSESDNEIYSIFFPAPWQIAMVVRPGRAGAMRAGFFVREADGTVHQERSYLEFNFPDRLAGVLDRIPDRPRERPERRIPSFYRESAAPAPAPVQAADDAGPRTREAPAAFEAPVPHLLRPAAAPPDRKWMWLAAWAVVVIALALIGLRYWMISSAPEPIALAVVERDGQLQVEWNRASRPVKEASAGALEIMDGPESKTIALTPAQLASGHFTYLRKSGDIEVRMTVQDPGGAKTQEASRFLGRPPAAPASSQELAELRQRRDALEAEVARLRRENDNQAAKIQQLERTLRVLQVRLGIDTGKQ